MNRRDIPKKKKGKTKMESQNKNRKQKPLEGEGDVAFIILDNLEEIRAIIRESQG